MIKIKCPCCNEIINVPSYYMLHREQYIKRYRERIKDPDFVERKRKSALKSYHKRKQEKKNDR